MNVDIDISGVILHTERLILRPWQQEDLADLCGLPHSSVARIESGRTTPKLSTLVKIFRQLGLYLVATPVNSLKQVNRE